MEFASRVPQMREDRANYNIDGTPTTTHNPDGTEKQKTPDEAETPKKKGKKKKGKNKAEEEEGAKVVPLENMNIIRTSPILLSKST